MSDKTMYERPRFLLQEANKTLLLENDSRNYYFIEVNRNLTWENEAFLLRYGVSEEILDNLALKHRVIPKSEVRGVALTGTCAGDAIYFYLRSGKKIKYRLTDDCSNELVNTFFNGVERFLAPVDHKEDKSSASKNRKEKSKAVDSWKEERRDPELFDKLRYVPAVLTVMSVACSIGYIMFRSWLWYLGCLFCLVMPVILDILLPEYFTLIPPEKGRKTDAWELCWPIFVHVAILIFLPGRNWLDENIFFVVAVICAVASLLTLGFFTEEFRRNKLILCLVCFLTGIMGTFVVGHVNEAFDFSEPEVYELVVEDLDYSRSRRSSTYECTVTLPDGREVDLRISRDFYDELEIGDVVQVEHSVGALGIEYANAYPVE